jgi:hypothetical protein
MRSFIFFESTRSASAFALLTLMALATVACDDGDSVEGLYIPPAPSAGVAVQGGANPQPEASTDPNQGLLLPSIGETDFIVGPRSRDPFLPAMEVIVRTRTDTERVVQRDVKLKDFDVSDLKLIGIITNINDPRAMVVAPDGTGFVLRRGDYVGRADFIKQGAHGETIQVNWRVARIHGSGKEDERGVYFARDDPSTSKGVDVTRFLPLYSPR